MKLLTLERIQYITAKYAPPPPAPPPSPPSNAFRPRTWKPDNRVKRCRAYLKKVEPAVAGQHGHDQTFEAARIIWNDFGIDESDAWGLLCEFNERCDPSWNEQDLRRKLDQAVKKGAGPEGRGYKAAERERPGANGTNGHAHPRTGSVPPNGTPPAGLGAFSGSSSFQTIQVNNRQYRDVEEDAHQALLSFNNPPSVFVGNAGLLVQVHKPRPSDLAVIRLLRSTSLRSIFARSADWIEIKEQKSGEVIEEIFPPRALLEGYVERGCWPGFLELDAMVTYPIFDRQWNLIASDGYHASAKVYCQLEGLVLPDVPDKPTPDELAQAKSLILDDLLVDFPFVDQASRANAVAMLILPIIRQAIDGPTPIAVVTAPTEGTGKSLLVEVCSTASVGHDPAPMSPDLRGEEWNKTLTALLIESHSVIWFDNANQTIDSGALAMALTARKYGGRLLGQTKMVNVAVNTCWVMTGNNMNTSREIARRGYWIRIDAKVETPAERTGFRHKFINDWAKANRPQLLWAALILVKHWLAVGQPGSEVTLGKFEKWATVVGGILQAAGIDGFMANADAFRRQSSTTTTEANEFVAAWWEKFQGQPVMTKDLFAFAVEGQYLESTLTSGKEEGRRAQLGKWLRSHKDRVVTNYRITSEEKRDHSGRPRYLLTCKDAPPQQPSEPDSFFGHRDVNDGDEEYATHDIPP